MLSAKWRQFCLGLNVLIKHNNLFKIATPVKYERTFQLVNVICGFFWNMAQSFPGDRTQCL